MQQTNNNSIRTFAPLPVGISDIAVILKNNMLYVDKTRFAYEMVKVPGKFFLSRPRRFGKSMLLSTFEEIFRGNKELFKDQWIYNSQWDWQVYPIIRLDFNVATTTDLVGYIMLQLQRVATEYKVFDAAVFKQHTYDTYFRHLISMLHKTYKQPVAILIDEYDKPILDAIDDINEAKKKRDILKGFYTVMKGVDESLYFVFLTGVSRFSKVGVFSGLNNLQDITLTSKYADICGYTQNDLETVFKDYLIDVDRAKLKLWYNGYNFAGSDAQKVYNPFDILLFLSNNKVYKNHWFGTGNPEFLIKLIQKNQYYFPNMEGITIEESDLSNFEVDNIALTTLLFQTGYLTIKETTTIGMQQAYVLGYPNLEVKASLNDKLAAIGSNVEHKQANKSKLATCLSGSDLNGLSGIFKSYFASIPHDWYRNNHIHDYEGFYASIVYSYFCALGYNTVAEDTTNIGQIDLTVDLPDKILILEFKLKKNGDAASAIQQIKDRRYADKYKADNKPIYLVGVSFDPESRNVHDFISEIACV